MIRNGDTLEQTRGCDNANPERVIGDEIGIRP